MAKGGWTILQFETLEPQTVWWFCEENNTDKNLTYSRSLDNRNKCLLLSHEFIYLVNQLNDQPVSLFGIIYLIELLYKWGWDWFTHLGHLLNNSALLFWRVHSPSSGYRSIFRHRETFQWQKFLVFQCSFDSVLFAMCLSSLEYEVCGEKAWFPRWHHAHTSATTFRERNDFIYSDVSH